MGGASLLRRTLSLAGRTYGTGGHARNGHLQPLSTERAVNRVPPRTVSRLHRGIRSPSRGAAAVSRQNARPDPGPPAREDTVLHRLRICLGDPETTDTACHYAYRNNRGGDQCKRVCCGPLAESIQKGVAIARMSCPRKRPSWGPESIEDPAAAAHRDPAPRAQTISDPAEPSS